MNILLTCAGRRNFLVRYFQDALGGRGRVLACDSSTSAPALFEADRKIIVPAMAHPEYYEALLAICREENIRLIVSVNDLELDGLARHARRFRALGTIPVVASAEIVATCHDKWAAFQWLRKHEILTPDTYPSFAEAHSALASGKLQFPLLIKPRWGTSSIGIEMVENHRELQLAYELGKIRIRRNPFAQGHQDDPDSAFVIQQRIEGQEYGIDVVNDLKGNYSATLARRKLVMRAGNTDRAISVEDSRLRRLGETLGRQLGHIGCVDCDLIDSDLGIFVLDMNPRLGGGYPFSHMAGANLPAALIAWAEGVEPDPVWSSYQSGVLSSKYDSMLVVESPPVRGSITEPYRNGHTFMESGKSLR